MSYQTQPEDLCAAYLIWRQRENVIRALIRKGLPQVDPLDIDVIISGCQHYSTCSEKLFAQLTETVTPAEAFDTLQVPQEVA
jgi:glutamate racemase